MTKLLQWIGKLMVGTILISGITLYVTWTTVHSYIDKLLQAYHLEAVQPGFADMLSSAMEDWSGVGGGDGADTLEDAHPDPTASDKEHHSETTTPEPEATYRSGLDTDQSKNDYSPSNEPKDPVEVQGSSTLGGAVGSTNDSEVVMTAEQFIERKESLSNEEKQQILTLLMEKLPEAYMQHLTSLVEDGITASELAEMKLVIKSFLDGNEYENLLHMINK